MPTFWGVFYHKWVLNFVKRFFCIYGDDQMGYFKFFKINLFIYVFVAELGLCCCARAFSSCGELELLFVAVCRFLVAVASLVAEHRL